MDKKILVVCSGGGARAIECHSGVVDAIKSMGIPITHGRGSSGGAVVLGFEMNGKSMSHAMRMTKMSDMIRPNHLLPILMGAPLYDNTGFTTFVNLNIGDTTIENLTVTMTDAYNEETMYVPGNCHNINNSIRIPEVFEEGIYTGEYKDMFDTEMIGENMVVMDGGVYDNIPVPNMKYASQYWNIFILCCNEDTTPEENRAKTRAGRAMQWINETMQREYRQVLNDWMCLPNTTVIRPPPFKSSLLNWSDNFGLYTHARTYAREILVKAQKHKLEFFRPE